MRKCPKCKSTNIETERRPNGNSSCRDCAHADPTLIFDQPDKESVKFVDIVSTDEIDVLAYPLRALKREVFQGKDFESKTILECVAEIKNLHIVIEFQGTQLKAAEQKLSKLMSCIFNLREEAFKSY